MSELLHFFDGHLFFKILLFAVALDSVLGVLRAVKEHKFNSCVGIDGAVRKVSMLVSIVVLMCIDKLVGFNFLFLIPEEYLKYIGVERIGICGLFCLLFILYEAVSILKNLTLCGAPVPTRLKKFIQKFLDNMTDELPKEVKVEIEAKVLNKATDEATYNQTHEGE